MSIACSGRVAVAAQSFRRRCFLPGCSSPGSHGGVDKLDCNLPKRRQVSTVDPNLSRRRTSPPVRAHVAGPETNRAMRQSTIRASRQSDSGVTSSLFLFPRLSASGEKICWGGREAGPYWLAGIVATGAAPLTPVSAMENSSIMIPNVYLDWMSASAIQNHLSWYCTATKASLGCASVTRTCKGDRRALLARRCQSAAANMPTCGGREGHSVWSHPSGSPGLTVHARCTPSRASARDASNTHRRQRAANNGLCSGDEAVHAWDLESFAEFQADCADDYRQ